MTNSDDPNDVIGRRVRQVRRRQDLTVAGLAARCAKFGPPELTETAIYLIEGGGRGAKGRRSRRRVTVEEFLLLAYALGVSPLVLLLPEEGDDDYPVSGNVTAPALAVLDWIVGARLLPADFEASKEEGERAWALLTGLLSYAQFAGFTEERAHALSKQLSDTTLDLLGDVARAMDGLRTAGRVADDVSAEAAEVARRLLAATDVALNELALDERVDKAVAARLAYLEGEVRGESEDPTN